MSNRPYKRTKAQYIKIVKNRRKRYGKSMCKNPEEWKRKQKENHWRHNIDEAIKMKDILRTANLGNKNASGKRTKKQKERMKKGHIGEIRHLSSEAREVKKIRFSGVNNPRWRGGITSLNGKIKGSLVYRQWKSDIFERDDYVCQECKKRGGELHAHHIKQFSLIMKENNIQTLEEALLCEELWNINNGQTLCVECHRKTDSYSGVKKEFRKKYV